MAVGAIIAALLPKIIEGAMMLGLTDQMLSKFKEGEANKIVQQYAKRDIPLSKIVDDLTRILNIKADKINNFRGLIQTTLRNNTRDKLQEAINKQEADSNQIESNIRDINAAREAERLEGEYLANEERTKII